MGDHNAAEAVSKLNIRDSVTAPEIVERKSTTTRTITMSDFTPTMDLEPATPSNATTTFTIATRDTNTTSNIATKDSSMTTFNATTNMNPQSKSPIFKLPRELRDMIYDYAFTATQHRFIALWGVEAHAPNPNLTLTCRRIHDETVELQQAALRAFWSTNHFTISCRHGSDSWQTCNFIIPLLEKYTVTPRQVEHMTHITINIGFLCPTYTETVYDAVDLFSESGSGAWERDFEDDFTSPWFRVHARSWEHQRCLSDKYLLLKYLLEMLHVWATEVSWKTDEEVSRRLWRE